MERKDWILMALYSPGKEEDFCEPVDSSLRIMKLLFMIGQENKTLPNFYNSFHRYLYGPCDFEVYTDILNLKTEGLIEETTNPFKNFSTFRLTNSGIEHIKPLFDSLSISIKKSIKDIKREVNVRFSINNLLKYVYSKYPGWDTNSVLNLK